ncbi:MAG: sigma-70 family RNA polymerase sigma factor [Acidobacteriota bacterium]
MRKLSSSFSDNQNFEKLLVWLHPERERAGIKYEEIRFGLIKIFTRRGCLISEELADETIDRVCRKVHDIADNYVGDPALYFYGVAKNVLHEYHKKKVDPEPLPPQLPDDNDEEYRSYQEKHWECLEHCLNELSNEDRRLIIHYFQDNHRAKIDHRREIADSLNISLNHLRVKIHRLKTELQTCIFGCLKNLTA